MSILDEKSDEEIRRAAAWWFTAAECYRRGEYVPPNVFAISTKGLDESDVRWARMVFAESPELLNLVVPTAPVDTGV